MTLTERKDGDPPVQHHVLFPHVGLGRALAVLGSAALAAVTLAACSSSPSASSATTSVKQQECMTVTNVLADGPDPDADSVGYAEAQVLPLKQLHLSDATLRTAVNQLDAAYKAFSTTESGSGTTNGANSSAALAVSKAEAKLNAICPNAAP